MGTIDSSVNLSENFPLIRNSDNVYLDSAATTQKPTAVLDAIRDYYEAHNANVHRAAHSFSEDATTRFENARKQVADFINAASTREIIWTRGTTESINLVANSYAASRFGKGDEILISQMEHHSNIVPWQLAAQRSGAKVRAVNVLPDATLDMQDFYKKLSKRTRLVALVHVSNATGVINPVQEVITAAHAVGAVVLLDGAQAVAHEAVDVQALDCDFYAFSGHKMYAPTGIGVLYGKSDLLESMPPWQGGGEMIENVTIEKTTFNTLPYKFEAGTPYISGAIGTSAAISYLGQQDRTVIAAHEKSLLDECTSALRQIEGVRVIGDVKSKTSIVSFVMDGMHPQDIGTLLDQQGIAVRTGHHCAQPLMHHLGLPGTVRASFALYNTHDDLNRFIEATRKVRSFA